MSASIAVNVPCRLWTVAVPGARALVRRAARAALAAPAPRRNPSGDDRAELAIVLADNAMLRDLNRRFRGKNKPTNVLSFPGEDANVPAGESVALGDVAIAFETAVAEAAAEGKTVADHLAHLVVHGVLHLRGYDHVRAADAERMEALEARVLGRIGVADPYAEPAREPAR